MKIQKFLLHEFTDKEVEPLLHIVVPTGSVLNKLLVLHDGIYAMYEISELVSSIRIDTFTIISTEQSIPVGAKYIDILNVYIELEGNNEGQQGVVIFPVYQIT